jgi:hypothetical protein
VQCSEEGADITRMDMKESNTGRGREERREGEKGDNYPDELRAT